MRGRATELPRRVARVMAAECRQRTIRFVRGERAARVENIVIYSRLKLLDTRNFLFGMRPLTHAGSQADGCRRACDDQQHNIITRSVITCQQIDFFKILIVS